ncbi:hypothetical protein ACFU8T_21260 [Sphingobacterium spiritivorum]|uniref:Uncharacterized protein n=1 Tax=Sphingobacterium spiritivorum ATCC 33861 TaxID=525373 RepID=D7VJV0_SPHSI|nr:hypothetical protein [Sphingobacterium spiritivorum]EFK58552.1 hypothetical protein HMPREF0766_11269 [Sphingobacterium spiritivorum ATCC 33861]QQT34532.1 hypothetical protein I6J01_14600 [Sphingobacterium spiritivorum]WQD35401.1 hypothetical protein U0038_06535 [Sphingobacterium spiritivorum]SUJ00308.1 Uncharacterised protein [Sphingobacterium spiritivorum]
MMKKYYIYILLFICILCQFRVYGQKANVVVEKVKCNINKEGYFLRINITKGSEKYIRETKDYFMQSVFEKNINDQDVLEVMKQLIPCFEDISLSCQDVKKYYINSTQLDFQDMPEPKSKNYTIAVDAMFAINRLVFNAGLHKISTFPVMFDSKTMKEVNSNPEKVSHMARRYKMWYKLLENELETKGKINWYNNKVVRYLNQGTVKWWDMILVEKGIRASL